MPNTVWEGSREPWKNGPGHFSMSVFCDVMSQDCFWMSPAWIGWRDLSDLFSRSRHAPQPDRSGKPSLRMSCSIFRRTSDKRRRMIILTCRRKIALFPLPLPHTGIGQRPGRGRRGRGIERHAVWSRQLLNAASRSPARVVFRSSQYCLIPPRRHLVAGGAVTFKTGAA